MLEKEIKIGNQKINYKEYGKDNKETIVILHGWGGKSDSWGKVSILLEQSGYKVIVPDIPGASKNTILKRSFTLDEYTILIENLIKTLNIESFILWGHSNGGAISIKLARSGKLNILRLVLNNSAGIRNDKKRSFKRRLFNNIIKPFKILKKLPGIKQIRNRFYRLIGSHDYLEAEKNPHLKQTYLNMISSDLKEEIKNIKTHTLLLWGEEDTYTPILDGNWMRNNIKNSKIVILAGEKHGIHLHSPEKLVNTFLNNI